MTPITIDQAIQLALRHQQAGRLQQAEQIYRQVLTQQPNHATAMHYLGLIAAAHYNLGNALKASGRLDEAIVAYRQSIALRKNKAETHNNLGIALKENRQLDEAIAAFRQAIVIRQVHDGAVRQAHDGADISYMLSNLGNALQDNGQLDEAVAAYRQAIALRPDFPEAHNNLGNALTSNGQLVEAIAAYRRAIALRPDFSAAHSNLVYTLHFHVAYDARAIAEEHRRWNEQHARPLSKSHKPHRNDPDPDRRLRIGYVSPDFRDHVVGRNLLPLFREHAHDRFEVFCYVDVFRPDELTARFRSHADSWRNIIGLSDEQSAERVREDRIDILVDLALHMARGRPLLFARKPAPVQVAFAGYPGSTGLDAIDYRLTDPYLDPPGQGEDLYAEEPIRLPDSFWCYDPAVMTAGMGPEAQPGPLPALAAGYVTFGCLNSFCKVNDRVLALWARTLKAAPGSRMILMAPFGSARQRTLEALAREGIDPARIELVPPAPVGQYLQRYSRIDIGLDTFPYNGHTTSLDALWMGTPVVTLVGTTSVGRAGLSQLTNLNLIELAAASEDEYVRIAAGLAGDLPRLSDLRAGLRPRMQASPLTDALRFARHIESAYQEMWRRWCRNNSGVVKGNV